MVSGRFRRVVLSGLVVGLVALVAGAGTYAAFSTTTGNVGNAFAAGTVRISDNDAGSSMLSLTGADQLDSTSGCIAVTYSGTLDADVHLYGNVSGALAPYLTLTVTRGTDPAPSFSGCAGFTPDGADYIGAGPGVIYQGNLSAYPATYGGGIVDPDTWSTSEQQVYRFTVTVQNDAAAEGLSSNASFTWEARNQ